VAMANIRCKFVLPDSQSEVATLQRTNTENSKHIFPEKEFSGHSPNFHIHVFESDIYIPSMDLPILLEENMWTDLGNI
jgi:hypothetical protein